MARRTATKMAKLVAQWRASGEPQARFARRHGISAWTFWYWSRKLEAAARPQRRTSRQHFVPVQVVPDRVPPSGAIEVVLVSGERLTIPAGASREQMGAVLAALRAPC